MSSSSWRIWWWCSWALEVRQPYHGYDGSFQPSSPSTHAPVVGFEAPLVHVEVFSKLTRPSYLPLCPVLQEPWCYKMAWEVFFSTLSDPSCSQSFWSFRWYHHYGGIRFFMPCRQFGESPSLVLVNWWNLGLTFDLSVWFRLGGPIQVGELENGHGEGDGHIWRWSSAQLGKEEIEKQKWA
jgi:hypothetical protein